MLRPIHLYDISGNLVKEIKHIDTLDKCVNSAIIIYDNRYFMISNECMNHTEYNEVKAVTLEFGDWWR